MRPLPVEVGSGAHRGYSWNPGGRLLLAASVPVVVIIEVVVAARPELRINACKVSRVVGHAVALIGRRLRIDAKRPRATGREVRGNSRIKQSASRIGRRGVGVSRHDTV